MIPEAAPAVPTSCPGVVIIRRPIVSDAAEIHQLVVESKVLDVNSLYLYLLLCHDFSSTCRVAQQDDRIIGFVSGYRPPMRPHVLFIWQITVAAAYRGQNVATRLLLDLISSVTAATPLVIQTTITDDNRPSRRLFEKLAQQLGCPLSTGEGFKEDLFGTTGHAGEKMFCLGPVQAGPAMATDKERDYGNDFRRA